MCHHLNTPLWNCWIHVTENTNGQFSFPLTVLRNSYSVKIELLTSEHYQTGVVLCVQLKGPVYTYTELNVKLILKKIISLRWWAAARSTTSMAVLRPFHAMVKSTTAVL